MKGWAAKSLNSDTLHVVCSPPSPSTTLQSNITYRIFVRLLVLGPVRRVGEPLWTLEFLRVFAAEGLVARVGTLVDLAVLQPREGARAALKLGERERRTPISRSCWNGMRLVRFHGDHSHSLVRPGRKVQVGAVTSHVASFCSDK